MENDLIDILAVRLGILSKKTIMKAKELMRLAEIRTTSGTMSPLQITYTCQVVICLELASLFANTPFNKDLAIRLAGVRKKVYQNGLQIYERILELHTNVTVKDIALQFGCMQVVELAHQVLKSYEREMQKRLSATVCEGVDLSQPVFAVASVSATCKVMKIRLDRHKLGEVSRAKKSTFDKLCLDMERHARKVLEQDQTPKKPKTFCVKLYDSLSDEYVDESQAKKPKLSDSDSQCDDYEDWKRRILQQTE